MPIANDPHLEINRLPNVWHEMVLKTSAHMPWAEPCPERRLCWLAGTRTLHGLRRIHSWTEPIPGLKNAKTANRVSMNTPTKKTSESRRKRRRRTKDRTCHCCREVTPFSWTCRCGFAICQVCMDENVWGMSCNGITWDCPDCGAQNGFGNQ
jgi:hypothetical protein